MTEQQYGHFDRMIIPYQELLGNYDWFWGTGWLAAIIPYQELLGNYDRGDAGHDPRPIIPYQELLGNYDSSCFCSPS